MVCASEPPWPAAFALARSLVIDVRPYTPIHTTTKALGSPIDAVTNARMVRPREILATNIPTNGAHVTVHAQ